jgi:hypothetical protein
MGEVYKQKISLKMIIYVFLLSCILMVLTTPIHEAAHWVMSDIDPYIEPIEIHIFNFKSKQNNDNIMSSALGYVVVRESYPGAFNDRPLWMDLIQELICISIQIILTSIIILKIFRFLINKNFNLIKNFV